MPHHRHEHWRCASTSILAQRVDVQIRLRPRRREVRLSALAFSRIRAFSTFLANLFIISPSSTASPRSIMEFLALGCIVLTPHFFGAERQYSRLPVHFLRPPSQRRALQSRGSDVTTLDGATQRSTQVQRLATITEQKLILIEKRLGSLARDVKETRRRLQPGYWASRLREHLGDT